MPDDIPMSILRRAKRAVVEELLDDHAHSVYIGLKDGKPCIVVEVARKLTDDQVRDRGIIAVPKEVVIDDWTVPTDVVEEAQSHDLRLSVDRFRVEPQASSLVNVRCQDCPIAGGAQIQPGGVDWVGTLTCGFTFPAVSSDGNGGRTVHGAMTNRHVAVSPRDSFGRPMFQPWNDIGTKIGQVLRWSPLRFNNSTNYVDVALIDCERRGGGYGELTHTVGNELIGLGPVKGDDPAGIDDEALGASVFKTGRTTGVTAGKIVGIDATSRVVYDEGTARFEDQLVIRGNAESEFSAGGDSGSLIVLSDGRPVGLLFAGGGDTTVANPIRHVLEWTKGRFFDPSVSLRVLPRLGY